MNITVHIEAANKRLSDINKIIENFAELHRELKKNHPDVVTSIEVEVG